jgi:type IV pilus assembly protein PilO
MAKIDLKKLKDIPKPARIAVAVAPAILLMALFGYFNVMPKRAQAEVLKADISKLDGDISKKKSMAARLDAIKEEHEKLVQLLKELEERLPAEKEISSYLKQVSDIARASELQILSWRPAPRRMHPSNIVYEVPVSVNLTGSYHNLGIFFGRLTRLNRIVNIGDIRMGSPTPREGEASLSVSFSAVTFTAVSNEVAAQ